MAEGSKDGARDWERDLFPEAGQKPLRDRYGLNRLMHTLGTIGVRTDEEAIRQGYVLIRSQAGRNRPGLWVHEHALPVLEAIAHEVARLRAEEQTKQEAREKEAEAVREGKRQLAEFLLDGLTFLAPEELERALAWAQNQPTAGITLANLLAVVRLHVIKRLAAQAGVPLTKDARRIALGEHPVSVRLWGEDVQMALKLGNADLPEEVATLSPTCDADAAVQALRVRHAAAHEASLTREQAALDKTVAWLEADLQNLPDDQQELWRSAARRAFSQETGNPRKIAREMERLAARLRFDSKLAQARALPSWIRVGEQRRQVLISASQRITLDLAGKPFSTRLSVTLSGEPWDQRLQDETAEAFVRATEQAAAQALAKKEAAWRTFEAGVQAYLADAVRTPDYPLGRLREEVARLTKGVQAKDLKPTLEAIRRVHRDHLQTAQEMRAVQAALEEHNLASFKDHFGLARSLDRSLTLYVGPTNSGKTHHALNELVQHASGVYLAPLRLLALEGQEELERRGVAASYLTGEERDLRQGATFLSATIEMLDTDAPVDAAVIDEVQLLADRQRGWAWSRALLGAPAKHVILTGSPDSVPLVEALCAYSGEKLEVKWLPRLTPLKLLPSHVPLERVKPGTAVIAFSRRNVLGLKGVLEGKHRVAVIYGNLSPDVRREEARRFRSGEADVLVATDAIAMGLNLPIETVLFFDTEKFNGEEMVPLGRAEILQIGGRAGRYGKYDTGFVGTVSVDDRKRVRVAFAPDVPLPDLPPVATVQPSFAHVEALAQALKTERLGEILKVFKERMYFDSPALVPASMDDIRDLARTVDAAPLALQDKFVFATAPVDIRNESIRAQFEAYVWAFAKGQASGAPGYATSRKGERAGDDRLYRAEVAVKTLTLYAWLAYRYPQQFPELERCNELRRELNELIETLLKSKGLARRCSQCGKPLPPMYAHGQCNACYRRRRWT